MSNALILTELLLNYAVKMQEIGVLFRNAQGGDVSDEQVNASSLSRDVAIAKAESVVGGTAQQPSALR